MQSFLMFFLLLIYHFLLSSKSKQRCDLFHLFWVFYSFISLSFLSGVVFIFLLLSIAQNLSVFSKCSIQHFSWHVQHKKKKNLFCFFISWHFKQKICNFSASYTNFIEFDIQYFAVKHLVLVISIFLISLNIFAVCFF